MTNRSSALIRAHRMGMKMRRLCKKDTFDHRPNLNRLEFFITNRLFHYSSKLPIRINLSLFSEKGHISITLFRPHLFTCLTLGQGGQSADGPEVHGFQGRTWHNDQRSLFLKFLKGFWSRSRRMSESSIAKGFMEGEAKRFFTFRSKSYARNREKVFLS